MFETADREEHATQRALLAGATAVRRESADIPDSASVKDAENKKLRSELTLVCNERNAAFDIAKGLVRKNNHDNDIMRDRENMLKGLLHAANKNVAMMPTIATPTPSSGSCSRWTRPNRACAFSASARASTPRTRWHRVASSTRA